MACVRISRIAGKMVRTMMSINEAIAILKKIHDCEMSICSDTYCSECPHWVGHIEKILALETAVDYVKRKEN
jgi:hypothetical protein